MKKNLFLLLISLAAFNFTNAQEKTYSLGLSVSYEVFKIHSNYFGTNENNKGTFWGVEYSESKRFLGYRAGVFYSRIKDRTAFDFDFPNSLFLIDIFILPVPSTLQIIDFPISGQVYLPLGSSRIRLYGNLGIMTSLVFFEDKTDFYFRDEKGNKSLSFRAIYGGGISYQFARHFGVDIGVNKKRTFYTLDDNFRKPFDSLSFQTIVNYVF